MKTIYMVDKEGAPTIEELRVFAPHHIGKTIENGKVIEVNTAQRSEDGSKWFITVRPDRESMIPKRIERFFLRKVHKDDCAEIINSEEWNSNNRFERENQEFLSFVSGKRWGVEPIRRDDIDPDKMQTWLSGKGVKQEDIDKLKEPFIEHKLNKASRKATVKDLPKELQPKKPLEEFVHEPDYVMAASAIGIGASIAHWLGG